MATWSQEDLDRLKAAISSGILTVVYDGPPRRSVTFQSLREMREALAQMEQTTSAQAGTLTTYRRVRFRKGFRDVY